MEMIIRIAALGPAANFPSKPGTNCSTKGSVKKKHPIPNPARLTIITRIGVARGPFGTRLLTEVGLGMPAAIQALTFIDARSRNTKQFKEMVSLGKLGGSVSKMTLAPSATAIRR